MWLEADWPLVEGPFVVPRRIIGTSANGTGFVLINNDGPFFSSSLRASERLWERSHVVETTAKLLQTPRHYLTTQSNNSKNYSNKYLNVSFLFLSRTLWFTSFIMCSNFISIINNLIIVTELTKLYCGISKLSLTFSNSYFSLLPLFLFLKIN